MKNNDNSTRDRAADEAIDAAARRQLERLVTANEFLVQWRAKHLGPAQELARAEPWITQHAAGIDHLTTLLREGAELADAGKVAGAAYWAEKVAPVWQQVFSDGVRKQIDDLHSRRAVPAAGFEDGFMTHLLDPGQGGPFDYSARHGKRGLTRLRQEPPEPGQDETAVARQPLTPPFARCVAPPFSLAAVSKADSGPAINVSSGGASTVDGSGFASAMTLATIAMGGGAECAVSIGTDIDYPPGLSTLRVNATLDVSWIGRSMTVLGGATASINVALHAFLPDGRRVSVTRLLEAIPAPLLWFVDTNQFLRNVSIRTGNIAVNGAPGPVRVFAGIEVYSAGVGLVGSSGARMSANVVVKSLCVSLV